MTTAILSPPLTSTSGRAPVFRATMRFWIRVDSLNRPPTLLTICSSFSSSSIAVPFELAGDDLAQFGGRRGEVVVNHLILIVLRAVEFGPGGGQPPLHRRLVLGPPAAQPALVLLRGRLEEHGDVVRARPPHLLGPLDVDVEDHTRAVAQVRLDLGPQRPII